MRDAHARGIRIVLDMVMNHTSEQHSWLIKSRASRDNPKRDWYIWRDPNSLLNYYQRLIAFRHASPALQQGTYRALNQLGDVYAYERATTDQRLLIALNFSSRPAQIKCDGAWQVHLSSIYARTA